MVFAVDTCNDFHQFRVWVVLNNIGNNAAGCPEVVVQGCLHQYCIFMIIVGRCLYLLCDTPVPISNMEQSLASLDKWLCANALKVNTATGKTQRIAFGTRQNPRNLPNFEITFRDTSLTHVTR